LAAGAILTAAVAVDFAVTGSVILLVWAVWCAAATVADTVRYRRHRRQRRQLRAMARDWRQLCQEADDHARAIGGTPCPHCRDYSGGYNPADRPVSTVASYPRYGDSRYGWVTVQCCHVCARDIGDTSSALYGQLTTGAETNPGSWYVVAHPLND
jgi:hypothetical protein